MEKLRLLYICFIVLVFVFWLSNMSISFYFFIFWDFLFHPQSSPETVLMFYQHFSRSSKKSRGWVFQKLDLGRNHLSRLLRLETGLFSRLMMVHWGLQEQFTAPKLLTFLLCTVFWLMLVDRWVSKGILENGWCAHLANIWVPKGTMHWERVRHTVISKITFLYSCSLCSRRKESWQSTQISTKHGSSHAECYEGKERRISL